MERWHSEDAGLAKHTNTSNLLVASGALTGIV